MQSKFEVARCAAFTPVGGSLHAWLPCGQLALWGDFLCALHRDALDGALLGLLAAQKYPRRAEKLMKKQSGKKA